MTVCCHLSSQQRYHTCLDSSQQIVISDLWGSHSRQCLNNIILAGIFEIPGWYLTYRAYMTVVTSCMVVLQCWYCSYVPKIFARL